MSVLEHTSQRMALASGKTSLTLDKATGKATLQRKLLFWNLRPIEAPLSEITEVTIDKMVDRASSVEIYSIMVITRAGAGWALAAENAAQAEADAAAIRTFLGLQRG